MCINLSQVLKDYVGSRRPRLSNNSIASPRRGIAQPPRTQTQDTERERERETPNPNHFILDHKPYDNGVLRPIRPTRLEAPLTTSLRSHSPNHLHARRLQTRIRSDGARSRRVQPESHTRRWGPRAASGETRRCDGGVRRWTSSDDTEGFHCFTSVRGGWSRYTSVLLPLEVVNSWKL